MEIGNLIQPINNVVGHPGEQLDEGHARIADIVISPFFDVVRDAFFSAIHNILEMAVIEFGGG